MNCFTKFGDHLASTYDAFPAWTRLLHLPEPDPTHRKHQCTACHRSRQLSTFFSRRHPQLTIYITGQSSSSFSLYISPALSLKQGYSCSSHHYPYRTILIILRVSIYIQALSLGPQSNVEQYGLRLQNPGCGVDDSYFSSRNVPGFGGQSAIGGIPLAKVAIRLYLNLYTTSDGQPPRNIKLIIVSGHSVGFGVRMSFVSLAWMLRSGSEIVPRWTE